MTYNISYEQYPTSKDVQILANGINEYAQQKRGYAPIENFAFFVRDEEQQIKGGCSGSFYYGCFYIDFLWLDESLRGQGFGTQLMKDAEELGKAKGCVFAAVNTMDWEALDFYKKLGYQVEFERHGFLKDSIFYMLRKDLNN